MSIQHVAPRLLVILHKVLASTSSQQWPLGLPPVSQLDRLTVEVEEAPDEKIPFVVG